MLVHRIRCGKFKNNNYLVVKDDKCLVIDITDAKPIIEFVKEHSLEVVGILLTHSHWDHLLGVDDFRKEYEVPVYLGDQKPNYIDNHDFEYTIERYGFETTYKSPTTLLSEGAQDIEGFKFDIINVPGHTYCSVIFHFKEINAMFTGDFLFRKTIGITTTMNSDVDLMNESIQKILTYDDANIYPGHGTLTTLKREKEENPFLLAGKVIPRESL